MVAAVFRSKLVPSPSASICHSFWHYCGEEGALSLHNYKRERNLGNFLHVLCLADVDMQTRRYSTAVLRFFSCLSAIGRDLCIRLKAIAQVRVCCSCQRLLCQCNCSADRLTCGQGLHRFFLGRIMLIKSKTMQALLVCVSNVVV